jgi:hypothetical protein
MAPTVFLKASSVPKIWNDGVRSQRRRLADLFGAAAEQERSLHITLARTTNTLPF